MAEVVQGSAAQPQSQIDEAKRQKLLELVRGRALARPTDLADDEVMVWPSLVVVEAVCATVFLLILAVLSIFVNAPLLERANPNRTPNPSKAPWYFLNLQELLLHMDKGLAGVIVPTVALVGLAAIPYVDRSPLGVGILGTSAKGRKIIAFSAIYTAGALVTMILLDEAQGRGKVFGIGRWIEEGAVGDFLDDVSAEINEFNDQYMGWVPDLLIWDVDLTRVFVEQVLPTLVIIAATALLMILVHFIFKPTRREMIIALFTGFYVSYIVLTIFGTSFRGEGQDLAWPWELPREHH